MKSTYLFFAMLSGIASAVFAQEQPAPPCSNTPSRFLRVSMRFLLYLVCHRMLPRHGSGPTSIR